MDAIIHIHSPLDEMTARSLSAGQQVLLSGTIYTARDAAHKRLYTLLREQRPLPIDLGGQTLYYTGPSPAKPGQVIGSAGPTTSSRMDPYTPLLIAAAGLRLMIGKGNRNTHVIEAMTKYGAVYCAATGGAGALLAKTIRTAEIVCYEDLGPEAIYKLSVERMPLIVAIDCRGGSLYQFEKE